MRYLALLLLLSVTGCTSLSVFTPNPRVEPPELRGDDGFKISAAVVGAHEFKATDDASKRPPDLSSPRTTTAFDTFAGGLYAFPRVEMGVELSPLHFGMGGILKFQALGQGTRRAGKGNVPLTFYVRAGTGDSNNSGDQNQTFGPGGYNWHGKISETHLQGGVSTGYRVSESALLYAGLAFGQFWISSEVDQDAHAPDPAATYKASFSGNATTGGGGVLFSWRVVQFYVSGEVTHIDYNRTGGMQDLYLHTGIYITPGGGSAGSATMP